MTRAIITIYISKCAQMDPQQLFKTSKFYSKCKKCDIKKTLGGWVQPPPLVARKLNTNKSMGRYIATFVFCRMQILSYYSISCFRQLTCSGSRPRPAVKVYEMWDCAPPLMLAYARSFARHVV